MKKKNQNSRREELHWDEESEEERQDRPAMRQKREHGPMMDGRVVGGSDSPAYMWTFLVGIRRNGVFYCSGTLISAYLVLTAAHCVHE
ncbi:Serine protease nudel [Portunus trituberculatus]|uniref:Serine protease nudel n=1 Tax=Portunus trituberculatus TaxID=210409 RepID=A0A5B7I0E2_PORTR|nr:Serine protease nudel [Portunus trituberculatus]